VLFVYEKNRKRLVAQRRRDARIYKGIAAVSVTFCEKGGATRPLRLDSRCLHSMGRSYGRLRCPAPKNAPPERFLHGASIPFN